MLTPIKIILKHFKNMQDRGILLEPVLVNEFYRLEGKFPTHIKIERTLIDIGGGGWAGVEFKNNVIKAAGWRLDPELAYSADTVLAVFVFNKIRSRLAQTTDPKALLKNLSVNK